MSHTSDELEPCPFCGGEVGLQEIEPHTHSDVLKALMPQLPDHPGSWVVECFGCDSGLIRYTRDEAISAWNRRAVRAAQPVSEQTAEPVANTWTLTGPDGRQWKDTSPIRVCAAAQRDTIPPEVALERVMRGMSEESELDEMADTERAAFGRFRKPEWEQASHLRLQVLLAVYHEKITRCGARIENLQDELAAPSPQISDEEILAVAAEHGYGWASERGVIPFSAVEEDGVGIVNLFHALLSRKEGK